jgi:hypothetical protein
MSIRPTTRQEVMHKLNVRFEPGEALEEMVAIQKDYQVFHPTCSLHKAYRLLDLGPRDFAERRLYFDYLDRLKNVTSDIEGMNAHDRIAKARQDNLESSSPLPMFTQMHENPDEKGVTVTIGRPFQHPDQDHVIISHPMIPAGRPAAAKRAAPAKKGK